MSKPFVLGIAGAALSIAVLAGGYAIGSRSSSASVPAGQQAATINGDLDAAIRNYLLSNPEILTEMQASLELKEREFQRVSQVETIRNASDEIFNASYDGVVGNPEGSVTVVEFFDYNCGFCKRAYEDMEAMVAADPDLRFVLKEFPILGPDSQKAHVVSMAFRSLLPQNYGAFHRELLLGGGRATEARAIEVALANGADEASLREAMKDPTINASFGTTYQLANKLSITGTPSYVIGNEVIFGALGQQVLEEKVEVARAN